MDIHEKPNMATKTALNQKSLGEIKYGCSNKITVHVLENFLAPSSSNP
jgi:hypothetical protein